MIGVWERPLFGVAIAMAVCLAALWVTPRGDRARHTTWIVAYLSLAGFDVLFDSLQWRGWAEVALDIVGTTVFGAAMARYAQSKLGRDHGLGKTILVSGAITLLGDSVAVAIEGLPGDIVHSLAIVGAAAWPMLDRKAGAFLRDSLDCAAFFAVQILYSLLIFGWRDAVEPGGHTDILMDTLLVALIGIFALATNLRTALGERDNLAKAGASARTSLESTTSLFRGFLENAPVAIFTKDIEGRYLLVNPTARRWSGYSEEMHMGASHQSFFGGVAAEQITELERKVFKTGCSDVREVELPPVAGNPPRWVLTHRFPLRDSAGRIHQLGGMAIDITKIKEFERELVGAKMVAEDASRTKSNFLAHMSHELRTPLNAIIGFSEVIHNRMLGPDANDAYFEYAGDIQRAGKLLLAEVNDLLDISRIEAGKVEVDPSLNVLGKIVSEAMHILRDQALRRAIDIRVVGEPLPGAWCDERATLQVLVNLVGNAIKYIQDGGTITISAEIGGDGAACLSISDNGPGIKPKALESLFDPWAKRSAMESTSSGRIGLGLMIARQLMKLQGGGLSLRSEFGKGTVATCEFAPRHGLATNAMAAGA